MAYPSPANVNVSGGFEQIFVYVNAGTDGLFINLLLFVLFVLIAYSVYTTRKDIAMGFASASFTTFVVALLFRLADEGLVNLVTLSICIMLVIASFLWLAFSEPQ